MKKIITILTIAMVLTGSALPQTKPQQDASDWLKRPYTRRQPQAQRNQRLASQDACGLRIPITPYALY
jgi:hypothetical protein